MMAFLFSSSISVLLCLSGCNRLIAAAILHVLRVLPNSALVFLLNRLDVHHSFLERARDGRDGMNALRWRSNQKATPAITTKDPRELSATYWRFVGGGPNITRLKATIAITNTIMPYLPVRFLGVVDLR